MDELVGKMLGPYTITEKIGEGGMAEVYKGYQESLNRYVALKVLRGDLARDQEFITRFRREALAVAKLSHPNILHVFDAGVSQGVYYIAMDYAEGGTLKALIQQGPLDTQTAVSIAAQLADALDYAHQQGLIHRDVKPSNVLLTRDGRPLLTDFGIAKALHEATHLTRTGTSIGTPDYMSPEQLQGQQVDGRTDIYALGVMLFEMLAGWSPFSAPTPMATLYKQMNEPPPPLRQVNVTIPPWLEEAVSVALAKRPELRYARAKDFAQALRQQQVTLPSKPPARARRKTPPPAPAPGRPITATRRSEPRRKSPVVPIMIGVIAVLLVALVGGGAYMLFGDSLGLTNDATPTAIMVVATNKPSDTPMPSVIVTATPSPAPTTMPDTPTPVVLVVTATGDPTSSPTLSPPTTGPTVEPTVEPTVAPPTAEPTSPPATAAPPTKTPEPSTEPGVIANFESFGSWRRGDEPNGTFTQSSAQAHQGSYSGKLDYNFGTSSNDYVVFQQAKSIGGQPTRITAWVYGDGSGHFLNAWIKDSGGQMWQVPLGTVDHTGWQQMVGLIDVNQDWPWTHISGADNGKVDYPMSFQALVLDDKPDTYSGNGTIYIDDLRTDTSSAGPAPAPAPTTSAGAQPTTSPSGGSISVSGRIAFSAGGLLHIVDAQTGQDTIGTIANMRQPDFHNGGQLVIVNGEGGGKDSLWTVRASGGLDREQSEHPDDYYPFFSPSNGSRFVYDSTMMGKGEHNLFVGNLNSRRENREPLSFGGGAIIGSRPIWLSNDMLIYTGCDYGFGNGGNCGLFLVPSWGGQPRQIVAGGLTELATDGYGSHILFTSQRDGNWELYLANADGSGLRNLSNSPGSNDGLGTFSPDGKLAAFVSNRNGNWAIWAIRLDGSGLTKLFNLPARLTGTWTDERISWGP